MDLKPLVEALLFVTEEPLNAEKIAGVTGAAVSDVRAALREIQRDCQSPQRGLQLMEIAKGYQLGTKPHLAPRIEKLFKGDKSYSLSQAALETLAVIAYRQPVTRPDIEAIRGVKADGVIETLLKRRFIRAAGRKDAPGRPVLYATTREFLKYFGLKDLNELPSPGEGSGAKNRLPRGFMQPADMPDGRGEKPPAGENEREKAGG